jgi:hypothetical protein
MGGSPTNYKQQVPENPALQTQAQKDALAANYARLQQQGMSDQGIVAPEQIMPALKSLGSDIKKGVQQKIIAPAEQAVDKYLHGEKSVRPTMTSDEVVIEKEMPKMAVTQFKDEPYAALETKSALAKSGFKGDLGKSLSDLDLLDQWARKVGTNAPQVSERLKTGGKLTDQERKQITDLLVTPSASQGASPNSFGRDSSKPTIQSQEAIDSGLGK